MNPPLESDVCGAGGATELMITARSNTADMAAELLAGGAAPKLNDRQGHDALRHARDRAQKGRWIQRNGVHLNTRPMTTGSGSIGSASSDCWMSAGQRDSDRPSHNNPQEIKTMEVRVLHYFLAVAREGNMTASAATLHITQPTLFHQIGEPEEELGCRLFAARAGASRATHPTVCRRL